MENNEILKTVDGAALAYLGDSVFELWVRERLLKSGLTNTGALNEASHKFVTAKSQCAAFRRIEELLTEDEMAYFKRGRNSTHLNGARSASGTEYRTATGFEALCAALYLSGENDRLKEILEKAFE
ncbi:MAG: ribonuclease III [Clostridia bacterium]|nr:ribonuclease III [Clostridia bacterium]